MIWYEIAHLFLSGLIKLGKYGDGERIVVPVYYLPQKNRNDQRTEMKFWYPYM